MDTKSIRSKIVASGGLEPTTRERAPTRSIGLPQVLLEVSLDRKPTIGEFLDKARSPRLPPQRVHAVCTRAYSLRLGSAGRMGRQGDRVCMLRD